MGGEHLTKEQRQQHSPAQRSQWDTVNRNRTTIQKITTRYKWQVAKHFTALRQEESKSIA